MRMPPQYENASAVWEYMGIHAACAGKLRDDYFSYQLGALYVINCVKWST